MSVVSVSAAAEARLQEVLERLRQRLIVLVSDASDLSGYIGQNVRDTARQQIDDTKSDLSSDIAGSISDAWDDGVSQASQELASLNLSSAAIPKNVQHFLEVAGSAIDSLLSDIALKVTALLSSASLGDRSKDDVLSDLRDMFTGFDSRAVGIANETVESTHSYAHDKRVEEATERIKLQAKSGTLPTPTTADGDPLTPCIVDVWMHTPRGGNPPRKNHVEMNEKGVFHGVDFKLETRDGDVVNCFGPKDPILPIGERINCRCRKRAAVLMVTQKEYDSIRQQSEETGGYRDGRWSD